MSLTVPPFSFYKVPGPHEMADKLVLCLVAEEREAAHELLVNNILPVKLAAIDRHPRPMRLTAVVYREIARLLSAKSPNMRLHALRLCAFEVFIEYMVREALNLAIVRFVLEHPGIDADRLGRWKSPQVAELMTLAVPDITDLAQRALDTVQQWKQSITSSYPAEWHKHKNLHRLVCTSLRCAETGEFEQADGQLSEFLQHVGQTPASS